MSNRYRYCAVAISLRGSRFPRRIGTRLHSAGCTRTPPDDDDTALKADLTKKVDACCGFWKMSGHERAFSTRRPGLAMSELTGKRAREQSFDSRWIERSLRTPFALLASARESNGALRLDGF